MEWHKLRSGFDTRSSFEELCCQLARYESTPSGSQFIRKGTPDAGIECYWELPNGSMWGWQAKYFLNSPTSSQWKQIDKSVQNAINKHQNLTKYYVCLPINRSDPEGQSFLQKWKEHVKKWKEKKDIKFEYWGSSEIEERLNQEEHRGRFKYFFDKEFFTEKWFEDHVKNGIETADPRYSPKLNITLPISKIFYILGREPPFINHLRKYSLKINKHFDFIKSDKIFQETQLGELDGHIHEIKNVLENLDKIEQEKIDFKQISKNAEKAQKIIFDATANPKHKINKSDDKYRFTSNEEYHLTQLSIGLSKIRNSSEDDFQVANTGALLLCGSAGTGKTHLLCDLVSRRLRKKRFSILLYGRRFDERDIKQQIKEQLDLKCTFNEFLGALEAMGQAHNSKILIVIDALNESPKRRVWKNYLAELLETISRYSWIGIIMSVRTPYEEIIIEDHLNSKIKKIIHSGFGKKTEEAIKKIFEYNGIEIPSTPVLGSEFSNPMFLMVLCKGLKNKRLSKIPDGLKGITAVYDYFIDGVNEKLSSNEILNFEKEEKIVQKSVEKLAKHMAKKNVRFLKYDDADKLLKKIYHSNGTRSLLHHLISEDILKMDYGKSSLNSETYVEFSYERLGDNLIVKNLFANINKKNITRLIKSNIFKKYLKDVSSQMKHAGIVDAISIQLPEKYNKELIQINPHLAKSNNVLKSFIDSLLWRHPSSINRTTQKLISTYILKEKIHTDRLLQNLLRIAMKPQNPLNAEYLHKYLIRLDMSERDSVWSTFLHYNYHEENSVIRQYLDWAWYGEKSSIISESVYLVSLVLSWFLTSSNRTIRDRATKGLISSLSNDAEILINILQKFIKCDDMYVKERLFCVAYGCAMRNNDEKYLKKLAYCVYSLIFKNGDPPDNFLLRDYAKNTIDCISKKNIKLCIDYGKINPPYTSTWIKKFPTEKTVQKLIKKQSLTRYDGVQYLNHSLSHLGDFYLYIMNGNMNDFEWSETPLLEKRVSREMTFRKFSEKITKKQIMSWDAYYENRTDEKNVKALQKNLNKHQLKIFKKHVKPYLEYSIQNKQPNQFDLQKLARWIIKRVFELGWTKERFGKFDYQVARSESYASRYKHERIGKKYQWIAYFELLARVCDNYEFNSESMDRVFEIYQDSWQIINIRDIDPSLLLIKSNDSNEKNWWAPLEINWDSENDDAAWIKNTKDLPSFKSMIKVVNKKDDSEWLTLNSMITIQRKISNERSSKNPYRQVFFSLRSFLCKKSDVKKINYFNSKCDFGDMIPTEHAHRTDKFLGELYWKKFDQQFDDEKDEIVQTYNDSLPDTLATTLQYIHEIGDHDCSTNEGFDVLLPSKLIVKKMNLINKNNGQFVNSNNELVVYDPSTMESGYSALLVKKDKFMKFLRENDYEIVWNLTGWKQILGDWRMISADGVGCLDIEGTFRIKKDKIIGNYRTQIVTRTT